jgi:hypothetical protein
MRFTRLRQCFRLLLAPARQGRHGRRAKKEEMAWHHLMSGRSGAGALFCKWLILRVFSALTNVRGCSYEIFCARGAGETLFGCKWLNLRDCSEEKLLFFAKGGLSRMDEVMSMGVMNQGFRVKSVNFGPENRHNGPKTHENQGMTVLFGSPIGCGIVNKFIQYMVVFHFTIPDNDALMSPCI